MTQDGPQEQAGQGMPEEWQELGRLYERFGGPMSESVLKARWARIEPNDQLSWDMRRASSTGLAMMEQELMEVFAAIDAAGFSVVKTDRMERLLRCANKFAKQAAPGETITSTSVPLIVFEPGDLNELRPGGGEDV